MYKVIVSGKALNEKSVSYETGTSLLEVGEFDFGGSIVSIMIIN